MDVMGGCRSIDVSVRCMYFVAPPMNGITANGGDGVREVTTYLQQVHTSRLHTIHPLTYGIFHDLTGHLRGSKHTPFRCADDVDRRLEVFDGSTLSTMTTGERRRNKGKWFGSKRP